MSLQERLRLWLIGENQSVVCLPCKSPTYDSRIGEGKAWTGRGAREECPTVILLPSNRIKATTVVCRSPWNIEIRHLLYSTVRRLGVRGNNFNFSSWWASTHGQLSQHNRWCLSAQFYFCSPRFKWNKEKKIGAYRLLGGQCRPVHVLGIRNLLCFCDNIQFLPSKSNQKTSSKLKWHEAVFGRIHYDSFLTTYRSSLMRLDRR